jgi:hypothetical protein
MLVACNRIVFIQEHHLLGSKLQAAMQQLARQGIKAWLSEANPTPKLGTSGGVGVLWGPGTHLIGHPKTLVRGRATAAIFDIPLLEHIMCVTVYGNSYSAENTISIVEQVVAHCQGAHLPYIIGGDFNLSPEELHSRLCDTPLSHQELQLVAP